MMIVLMLLLSQAAPAPKCHIKNGKPDPKCTPGVAMPITIHDLCVRNTQEFRDVPKAIKSYAMRSYGYIPKDVKPGSIEVDHFIPLELGGSNDVANLWPQPASPTPGFHQKDLLENALHRLVCKGVMPLKDAQQLITNDWLKAYSKYVTAK